MLLIFLSQSANMSSALGHTEDVLRNVIGGVANKKSKSHMKHFKGPLCHKCNLQKENFKQYRTTEKITSCEICELESNT